MAGPSPRSRRGRRLISTSVDEMESRLLPQIMRVQIMNGPQAQRTDAFLAVSAGEEEEGRGRVGRNPRKNPAAVLEEVAEVG